MERLPSLSWQRKDEHQQVERVDEEIAWHTEVFQLRPTHQLQTCIISQVTEAPTFTTISISLRNAAVWFQKEKKRRVLQSALWPMTSFKPAVFGVQECALHCEGEEGGNMSSDFHIIPFTTQKCLASPIYPPDWKLQRQVEKKENSEKVMEETFSGTTWNSSQQLLGCHVPPKFLWIYKSSQILFL